MTHAEAFQILSDYFVNQFEVPREKISLEAQLFSDLGLDSIDALDMVGALEAEHGIEIDEAQLKSIRKVGDVVEFLVKACAAK